MNRKVVIIASSFITVSLLFAGHAQADTIKYPYLSESASQLVKKAENAGLDKEKVAELLVHLAVETDKTSPQTLQWADNFIKKNKITIH